MLSFFAKMPELAVAVVVVILLNGVFSFWQEYKAEKATEELRKLLPYMVKVVRDGRVAEIESKLIVPGDIVILSEGDKIPADIRLLEATELRVDASVLTGESKPERKDLSRYSGTDGVSAVNIRNICFAGTNVVSGSARGVVYATGMNTEFGKIAKLTQSLGEEPSPLQKEMVLVTRVIAAIAISMGIIFYFLGTAFAGLKKFEGLIFAIGIIVANVPEGLLPTITLALALAVQRMSKKNALVKKLSSVETLGSCTVICTDKTGTLTRNEMTVKVVWSTESFEVEGIGYTPEGRMVDKSGKDVKISEESGLYWLSLGSYLCNNAKLTRDDVVGNYRVIGDTTEAALLVFARKTGINEKTFNEWQRLREIPFTSSRKKMSVICKNSRKGTYLFIKGASEVILDASSRAILNGREEVLDEKYRQSILKEVDTLSSQAYRVLAFGIKKIDPGLNIYAAQEDDLETDLTFVGLAAIVDPVRPEVIEAVEKCKAAGVKIYMITGDHALTAGAVARKIGIADDKTPVISGSQLDRMTDDELKDVLRRGSCIFARVSPEHKLRLVTVLKENGEIVAMTGDGVNDAPALKKADIGVAMGITGTDVAKEAADMILLDDNFATIVNAIEEGRGIFDNIRKFITYIFASNIPEIVPYLVFVLSGGKIPLPLTVLQILAVDVGTDLLPALALGAEPPESDVMKRPPRSRNERLLNLSLFARAYFYLGIIEGIACMASFFYAYIRAGLNLVLPLAGSGIIYLKARTMCLASIITSQVGNGFACRTNRESVFKKGLLSNKMYLSGIVYELTLISLLIYVPFLARIFGHVPLDSKDWLFLFIWPPIVLFAEELRKWIVRRMSVKVVKSS